MRRTLLVAALFVPLVAHAETCRFAGVTSRGGQLELRTATAEADGVFTVDARVAFSIRIWGTDYRYLGQEISAWRGGALDWVAVNQRYLADGEVTRQQWDLYRRHGGRLEASRAQAKRRADFARSHPGLLPQWPAASFGGAWLADYARGGAERRPDLDLPADGVRTPLAAALFWSRFLPPGGAEVELVLPSFKRDKLVTLRTGPGVPVDGGLGWTVPLHYPALEAGSVASVRVSPEHYLLGLTLDVGTRWVSGHAAVQAQGCTGVQIRP